MPPYIGKKALKQQRQDAERACLRHSMWTRLFFARNVEDVGRWLRSPECQPLWSVLSSSSSSSSLEEVILPATREEVYAEHYRVSYCRSVAASPWPETQYERLVACLFEHDICSDDGPSSFVSARALRVYLSLLEIRERNVARLSAELQRYTVFDRADVVELERQISLRAWQRIGREGSGSDGDAATARVDEFLQRYDMEFANIAACVWGGGEKEDDETMRAQFATLLFERKQHAYLVENHFQVLNAGKWAPVAERVNRPIERMKLEANSDYYTCRRCKRKETNVQSLQLRSSDEPATIIVTCIHCHARFTAKN